MQTSIDTEICKRDLIAKLKILAEMHGWVHAGRPSISTLIQILTSNYCDRKVQHILENAESRNQEDRFDPYYREKSEFATIRVLEHTKTALTSNGLDAVIQTESRNDVGKYDVVIAQGSPSKVYADGEEKIRIEIKASYGISLEQISRYLWHSSPLILVRVMTGHVAKIDSLKLQPYVMFIFKEIAAKADRILSCALYTVPGRGCFTCHDRRCRHNRYVGKRSLGLKAIQDEDFGEDLSSFFRNLSYVSERAANIIVEELRRVPSQKLACNLQL
jgi:hypothetical protein